MKISILLFLFTAYLIFSTSTVAQSQEKQDDQEYYSGKIKIRIDGIACPFCSLGLEKKLKDMEGVEKVEINIEDAYAVLFLEKDTKISRKQIFDRITKAGFTPVELTQIKSQ